MSQEELAERIDISRETVSRIENGVSPYSQDFLELAAQALGCEPGDLINVDPSAWPLAKLVAKQVAELREEQQKEVLTMIRALVDFNKAA